ncbi:hypothetical protein ACHAWF_002981 [Thalassiosira exigua]
MDADDVHRPYKCTVHLALPSNQYARHLKDVVSVDKEISNKVVKSFAIVEDPDEPPGQHDATGGGGMRVLEM